MFSHNAAHGVCTNTVGAVLKQAVKICNVFVRGRHAVWLCLHIQYGGEVWCLWLPSWVFRLKLINKLLDSHYLARVVLNDESAADVVAVEAEWSASGDVRDSADESVLDGLSAPWQVQRRRVSSFHHAVVSLLVLASDIDWLATVNDSSVGEASAEEADWRWVVCLQCYHSWTCSDRWLH